MDCQVTEFLKLLAIYYMCDSAASTRPLTAEELIGCQRSYEMVKTYFSGLEGEGPLTAHQIAARNRAAYAGFKAWETDNAILVANMRKQARAELGG